MANTFAEQKTVRSTVATWVFDGNGDGDWLTCEDYDEVVLHVIGTDYGSGTLVIEGSNSESGEQTLDDWEGNAISLTTGSVITKLAAIPRNIRPSLSGASSPDLTVIALGRNRRG
jgi:hypothetical protein